MLEFLKSDVFRRIVATLVAIVLPIINRKTGLELNDTELVAIICAIGLYVAQSGLKAAKVAAAEVQADAHVQAAKAIASRAAVAVPEPKPTPHVPPPL